MLLTLLFLALVLYGVLFALLWGWSAVHAFLTPQESLARRTLWTAAILVNPAAAMWYWYIWKRWAFWTLFAPSLLFMLFLPATLDAVIRTLEVRSIADRFVEIGTLFLQNVVEAIPLPLLIPIVAFPIILRLAALMHLGQNATLKAADRNDYAIAFALPIVGFSGAFAYSLKWQHAWAAAALLWYFIITLTAWSFLRFL
ncbi:MAG: hypothetical protein RL141_814 [Candidatus Parcubacteria bacterium]|jgi:hypothetical protein